MPETELELNTDDVTNTSDASGVTIVDDSPAPDLAPGPEGEQEKAKEPTLEEKHEKLQATRAQEKFEMRRERREREQAQHELAQLQAQQANPIAERPDIPDVPDQFADDFAEQQAKRDTAIREAERFDAQSEWGQQRQIELQQQAQHQQHQEFQKTADTFKERATKLGISDDELKQNGERLISYQVLSTQEIDLILSDEQGPLITKFLANNPVELERLISEPAGSSSRMSMLLTDIKTKASALKAKTTSTPAPLDSINGNSGSVQDKYPGTDGMTFT